jgi:predicted methyltransferase
MDEGYIYANKFRRAVFEELSAGEQNINRIAKKHRIFLPIVKRVMHEFEKEDIIKNNHGQYQFTKKGERLKQSIG